MSGKILFVDDEPDLLKIVTFRLTKLDYEILTASNGQEALDSIEKERFDLILLDLRLPVISGYEVCRRIKADDRFKNIPVILFTASVEHDISEKAREVGADDYLIKPFEPRDLIEKVKKFIG